MQIEIHAVEAAQHAEFIIPAMVAFGNSPVPERIEQIKRIPELDVRLSAVDRGKPVGCAASFSLIMTTPGGSVTTAGLSMVSVLPTHRRQGVLTSLMRRYLDDTHARGQHVSALWASEGPIYGRFGYGMASMSGAMSIERERTAFFNRVEPVGRARLVDLGEALELLPQVWDRVRAKTPAMLSRSKEWWEVRRLQDLPGPSKGPPLQRVVIEVDGQPDAYALYRSSYQMDNSGLPLGNLQVVEAIGATPLATRLVWRYLFDVDLTQRIESNLLPVDHPLLLLLAEPRRMRLVVGDGLYIRLVDVEAALSKRAYGSDESLTFEVFDRFCPWNAGRFRLDGAGQRAERTNTDADVQLDVSALASAYLGGLSFRQLAIAGRAEERVSGAIARADRLFQSVCAPWSPELF